MRILKVAATNFQSYRTLEFDFESCGLTGIFGSTGAGKSTLMDVIPWALFGTTGKDSAADDVRSWDADEPTRVVVMVDTPAGIIDVVRTRAPGKNDLYWIEYGRSGENRFPSDPIRGKDLKDTQKLLETHLGVTADLFMMSAYMSQFSEADSFFVSSAKERRAVLEKIADQEFAIKLGDRTAEARKVAKKKKEALDLEAAKLTGAKEATERALAQITANARDWDKNHAIAIAKVEAKCFTYAQDTAKAFAEWEAASTAKLDALYAELEALPESKESRYYDEEIAALRSKSRCGTCNALSDKHADAIAKLREEKVKNQQLADQQSRLHREYKAEGERQNPHQLAENPYEIQLRDLKDTQNPFTPNLDVYQGEIAEAEAALERVLSGITCLQERLSNLTWLYDKSFELRGLMMERIVRQIEEKTNDYLERFFDGALRVTLRCADSDKIDVTILNDGHTAPFKQLSGGERTMLKLAFTLSLMRAAQNKAGVALNCIMLDEPLNGLPEDLKVKAFGLFEELTKEYPTVLVIDHSTAFQQQFVNSFFVDKSSGFSSLD